MLFKETPLDPNIAVSPEKHLFSTGKCLTTLPKLNIQKTFAPVLLEQKF